VLWGQQEGQARKKIQPLICNGGMPFQGNDGNGICGESLHNSVSSVKGMIVLVQVLLKSEWKRYKRHITCKILGEFHHNLKYHHEG
jgi:hypothetical protein